MVRSLPASARGLRHLDLIPGSGTSPGGGRGNSRQYSCLENHMDRGVWWATVSSQGCKELDTIEMT